MAKREVSTDQAPAPGGAYSQGIVANGFLYTAGIGPHNPQTKEVVGSTIEDQTRQTMANLKAILAAEGLDFSDVVKTTAHLQNSPRDFAGFNTVYSEHFEKPFPVRTTVGSQLANILVEIDFVAALRQ